LALTGSSYDETEPKKSDLIQSGTQLKNPTLLELIPAAYPSQ